MVGTAWRAARATSVSRRVIKNGSLATTSAGMRCCAMDSNAVSISRSVRALVVALTDQGLRFSNIPNDIEQELRYVEAAGTKTLLIAADPGKVHLLSAAEI